MPKYDYDVFISFAKPDQNLAQNLHRLLTAVGLTPFFAPEALIENAPHNFEEGIKAGLKKSRFFLPVFTRESLNRKWVIAETGAAVALGREIFAVRVSGVDDEEIKKFPFTTLPQIYRLYNDVDLKALIEGIGKNKDDKFFHEVAKAFQSHKKCLKYINDIKCDARKRWVFIAGNIPNEETENATVKAQIASFVGDLTVALFEKGFNLSACPQVPSVGKVVLDASEKYIAGQEERATCSVDGCSADYEIAGIYPIDQGLETTLINDKRQQRWRQHLFEFRRSYLLNKDWLIIIGGNKGTIDEFEVVTKINKDQMHGIKVCFITHFCGAAKSLYEEQKRRRLPSIYVDGCDGWKLEEGFEKLAQNVAQIISTR